MILIEETTVADAALPLDEFKEHLRLGTGFAEDSLQDGVLRGFLRAAISAIEARTGKALISRGFVWTLSRWRDPSGQILPIAPIGALTEVVVIDSAGVQNPVPLEQLRIEDDAYNPKLCPIGFSLPSLPAGSSARIRFDAGFAPSWGGLPADLGQAVLLLAAHYYEYRHETALSDGCMPFGVTSLVQRYRPLRISTGRQL